MDIAFLRMWVLASTLTLSLLLFYSRVPLLCSNFHGTKILSCQWLGHVEQAFILLFDWLHPAPPRTKFSALGKLMAVGRWGQSWWWRERTVKCRAWNPAGPNQANLGSLTGNRLFMPCIKPISLCLQPGDPRYQRYHSITSKTASCLTGHLRTEHRVLQRRWIGKYTCQIEAPWIWTNHQ